MDINSFFEQYVKDHPETGAKEWINPVPQVSYCLNCREILSAEDKAKSDICSRCQREELQGYGIRQLLGRLRHCAARDHGILNHAVVHGEWKAMCGAQPGRRSVGWVAPYETDAVVTCPRCEKKVKKLQTKTQIKIPQIGDIFEFDYTDREETTKAVRLIVVDVTDTHIIYKMPSVSVNKIFPMDYETWLLNTDQRRPVLMALPSDGPVSPEVFPPAPSYQ